jgi:hypothetical protein
MPRLIEVVISPQGEVTVRTTGYVGTDCLRASQFLEQTLGVAVSDHRTADYYQAAATEQRVRQ